MHLIRIALAIVGIATVLLSCTPGEPGRPDSTAAASTTSSPLAPTQLVGRTFAEADAMLRRTTIATSDSATPFRGAEAYRITAQGAVTPITAAQAAPLTVVTATFAGPKDSPMDDVRAGLVVADENTARPTPGSTAYRELEDRLLEAMGLQPPAATTVAYLYLVGGEGIDDVFWRFVERAVRQQPLTREATTALAGRALAPVSPAKDGQYSTQDDKTWIDGVRFDRVLVAEDPTTAAWQRTTFDVATQNQICAVNIENVLRARYTVTPPKADDVHVLGEPTAHRAIVSGGVIDFFLTTDCITSVALIPTRR